MIERIDYQAPARAFLESISVTFNVVLIGFDCPRYCEDSRKNREMDKVNVYPRKSHFHGKHYRVTFSRRKKVSEADGKPVYSSNPIGNDFVIDFWNSYADEEFNAWKARTVANIDNIYWDKYKGRRSEGHKSPKPYDVLACLQKSDVGTFEDFCGDFGYDTDSRTAEDTYRAVVGEWSKVRAFFTASEIEQLQEIN